VQPWSKRTLKKGTESPRWQLWTWILNPT